MSNTCAKCGYWMPSLGVELITSGAIISGKIECRCSYLVTINQARKLYSIPETAEPWGSVIISHSGYYEGRTVQTESGVLSISGYLQTSGYRRPVSAEIYSGQISYAPYTSPPERKPESFFGKTVNQIRRLFGLPEVKESWGNDVINDCSKS